MSIQRWNAKTDTVQSSIVEGLEKLGVRVWVIRLPCDLLCWFRGVWQPLEVKTPYGKKQPKARMDKRQKAQLDFLRETQTPVVTSLDEALTALGISVSCTSHYSGTGTSSVAGH